MTSRIQKAQAEAAEWLIRQDAGSADVAAFEAWRDADPRHRVAYAQAVAAWEGLGRLEQPALPAQAADEKTRVEADFASARRRFLRAAACALPAMAAGGLGWKLLDAPAYASTGVGEQRRFSPVPGLYVMLNTDSRMRWKSDAGHCSVWLDQGEVALTVDGSASHRVTLYSGARALLLIAGDFNARSSNDGASEVLILSGSARIAQNETTGTRHDIGRGEIIRFSSTAAQVQPAPANLIRSVSAWRRGELVFDGETLGQAVAEYNRYLDRKLAIDDPAVAAIRIGGRFDTAHPSSFTDALETTFGLHTVETADRILVKRNLRGG